MSTDLEFIRLPIIKINSSQNSDDHHPSCVNEDQDCHTPKSPQHMIPTILICPPAPRKPRRRATAAKRKLCELQFFEIVARDEVESFFRVVEENNIINGANNKRKCLM
ncbi:hypothetical protein BUALT_Bualt01G0095100 [Buddleja alternifolia]|uniref:Cyclin-dependent protein kinase inhibitor SMR1 n=1 Tax=Buddleja alternifolia TaxID=168488 RepID=A0AAV6YG90_9LAMI|nr:hypothetical protein BUALT_Bualt01G0095100 [Buddleja alternifolia]